MTSPVSAIETIESVEEALSDSSISTYPDFTAAVRDVIALARHAEAFQRENAELREALKPFASVANYFGHLGDDGGSVMVNIYLGSLRRARALLGGSEYAE